MPVEEYKGFHICIKIILIDGKQAHYTMLWTKDFIDLVF